MNEEEVVDLLQGIGCWKRGHFVLRNPKGNPRHSGDYMDNDPLMANGQALDLLGRAMAERVAAAKLDVHCVTGPAEGGMRLARSVGLHLSDLYRDRKIWIAHNSKVGEGFAFDEEERAKLLEGGTLVVEDTVTTGSSLRKVVDLTHEFGGHVVAATCVLNRGDATAADLDVATFLRLVSRKLPTFDPGLDPGGFGHSNCPLCRAGVQIDLSIGNGKWFVDAYGQPPKSL